jgi:Leucine-rich repeat (LRR) protein
MLPATIARQLQLEFLDLNRNVLESIPEEIGALRDLRMVDVSHNKLAVLPDSMRCVAVTGFLEPVIMVASSL